MTNTETFIRDAIEGGWKPYQDSALEFHQMLVGAAFFKDSESAIRTNTVPVSDILLDPAAWKAVGRARGWPPKKAYNLYGAGRIREHRFDKKMAGLMYALAEGKSAEEYLGTILPAPTTSATVPR